MKRVIAIIAVLVMAFTMASSAMALTYTDATVAHSWDVSGSVTVNNYLKDKNTYATANYKAAACVSGGGGTITSFVTRSYDTTKYFDTTTWKSSHPGGTITMRIKPVTDGNAVTVSGTVTAHSTKP